MVNRHNRGPGNNLMRECLAKVVGLVLISFFYSEFCCGLGCFATPIAAAAEMVNLIHLCGMGFMRPVQQGFDSVHVEYTFGKEVV